MTDRPILFSGPMVRALLAGRKTQTRRVVASVPPMPEGDCHPEIKQKHPAPYLDAYCGQRKTATNPRGMGEFWNWWQVDDRCCLPQFRVGYVTGDRLWVREAHAIYEAHGQHRNDGQRWGPWGGLPTQLSSDQSRIAYFREGFDRCHSSRWRPSIHMPRWASRLTLVVTEVRVERLQDITEADARAEGIAKAGRYFGLPDAEEDFASVHSAVTSYSMLWDSLNAKRGDGWDTNPWISAVTFSVEMQNIDMIKRSAA